MWFYIKIRQYQQFAFVPSCVVWQAGTIGLHCTLLLLRTQTVRELVGYDFRIWGQRFFPFFQHGSMPKPYNIIILPLYSGADKRSPVIPTQTLSLHNTKYHGYGKYSLTDVNNNTLRDHFKHHY